MPHLYLVTFEPLVFSAAGRDAVDASQLPPFIDGSIRREPDLMHKRPAITCLCRAGRFVPRLEKGDVVVYLTKKAGYLGDAPHRRVVAALRVTDLFDSHADAAKWYTGRGFDLPSNCMVAGNKHRPLEESHRRFRASCAGDVRLARQWDGQYQQRAKAHPRVVVTKPLWIEVSKRAPKATDAALKRVFGRLPGTQNPGALDLSLLPALASEFQLPASRFRL